MVERRLVGVRNAGEAFEFAGQRLLVQPLDVAPDQRFQRAIDVNLEEALVLPAHLVAHLAIGRDRRRDRDHSIAREQLADVPDAPDVGVAVLLGEPQPFGQVGAHLVAVEDLDPVPEPAQFLGGQSRQR
jgi:hypothetical protein